MPTISSQRTGASIRMSEKVVSLFAIVHCNQEAFPDCGCSARNESLRVEIDLRDLAFDESQPRSLAVFTDAGIYVAFDPNKIGFIKTDAKFAQPSIPHRDAVHRKRIDQLV